ncbi:MAG: DUF1338 domain-containing protein [Pirellulaceae bacterium]
MSRTSQQITGPHRAIEPRGAQEAFLAELFDLLWDRYRQRVSYVRDYEQVVADCGATFVNDHIAFRTFACQQPQLGIASVSRIFEALGYRPAGCYHFPDKHLAAVHFQHPRAELPKLFISELQTWELADDVRREIEAVVVGHREPIDADALSQLATLREGGNHRDLMDRVVRQFHELPWSAPEQESVEAVGAASQYAAWVLVHGYNVNHFTSLINSHGVPKLGDIEKTIAALKQAGVPMKAEIEGDRGSKLRQSATEAVKIDVDIQQEGQAATMPWTYAYFELAERGQIVDPETGEKQRFEGFLGPQATQLFEMTRIK